MVTLFKENRPLSRRQARWVETLQEHSVPDMEYVPGVCLPVPDALSRREDLLDKIPSPESGLSKSMPNEGDTGEKEEALEVEGLVSQSLPRHCIFPPTLEKAPKATTTA